MEKYNKNITPASAPETLHITEVQRLQKESRKRCTKFEDSLSRKYPQYEYFIRNKIFEAINFRPSQVGRRLSRLYVD